MGKFVNAKYWLDIAVVWFIAISDVDVVGELNISTLNDVNNELGVPKV